MSVWCIDALEGLAELRAASVDLVLSDLPSGETQADFDVRPDLPVMWDAFWRVLKPTGVAVLMASSLRFAAALVRSQTKFFRYDIIWEKTLATGFLNAAHRPLRAHEFILVFYRRRGTYNKQMEEIGKPIHAATRVSRTANYGAHDVECSSRVGATDRYPRSVLRFASVGTSSKDRVHPQQKPADLMRWLVRTYSNVGDFVVDPYAGSGVVCTAAKLEGRQALGFDLREWGAS